MVSEQRKNDRTWVGNKLQKWKMVASLEGLLLQWS